MNNYNLAARLPKDAVMRTTQNGKHILNFSLPDEIGFGNNKRTQWINCVMFGTRAESLEQYLNKGALVQVAGNIELNEYTNKQGEHKASLQLVVNDIKLLGGDKKPQRDNNYNAASPTPDDGFSDDIPF